MENFSIWKNDKKEKPNHPDYTISTKINDKYETWGACWLKTDKNGKKFLSCTKSKPRPVENTITKPIEYPKDDINPDDISF